MDQWRHGNLIAPGGTAVRPCVCYCPPLKSQGCDPTLHHQDHILANLLRIAYMHRIRILLVD